MPLPQGAQGLADHLEAATPIPNIQRLNTQEKAPDDRAFQPDKPKKVRPYLDR